MAETVAPSVRGAPRIRVVTLLVLAGVVTGAGSAAAVAAVWDALGLPHASATAAVLLAAVAIALDALDRPHPLDTGRQVPQLWGRVFSPETVAVLYGARLGVGPLTILTSWLWWAAIATAVTLGPPAAALAGAGFHVARVVTMLVVTACAQSCMPARIATVRARERRVARTTAVLAGVLAAAVLVSGCSEGDDRAAAPAVTTTTAPAPTATTTTRPPVAPTPETTAMDDLLPDDALPGFTRVPDGTRGAGPLDLEAAAAAERDTQAERAVLSTRGFTGGVARVWAGPGDDTVYVALYEFRDAAGAAAYLADGRELLEARRVREFPVDVAGAFGFTEVDETSAGAFVGHAVAFTVANRYGLVIVGGDGSRRTPDDARDVARRVADRLTPPSPTPDAPS